MSEREQQLRQQHELNKDGTTHKAATQVAAKNEEQYLKNPEFLKQLQDPDVDTDLFDWVQDEFGPVFSGAHILGNRSEHYEHQQELLNRNKVERMVAERSPGRLLRDNPKMNALAQGIQGTPQYPDPTQNPAYRGPLTSRKERVIRDAGEVMTNRETLSIDARGLDAVATATVENRTVSNEEKKTGGIRGKVSEVFR